MTPPSTLDASTSPPLTRRNELPNGKKALLRISNLNVKRFYTLDTTGLPMQVVGTGAHILRGPADANMYYTTNSVTLGGRWEGRCSGHHRRHGGRHVRG